MNKRIRGLAWGLSLLCTTASAADNINTPGDQQWLKQQENLSEQLRQHPDK
ncbi:type-F conjugative transfer system pilin assembly protein TrbC, partial [Klebsiella pneumoniae]